MNSIINQHGTKIYGALTAFFGALQGLITTGAFNNLMSTAGVGWLGIFSALATAVLGGMTMARGFNNSTAEKVASVIETAINSTPSKQGGFVRPGFLVALATAALVLLSGCATNPETGRRELSASGKVILADAAGLTMSRFLRDSPRAIEKARNIRDIAVQLQAVTGITTVAGLRAAVEAEVDRLGLNPIDRADASRFLNILQALLTESVGDGELDSQALVRVDEFVQIVLQATAPFAEISPPTDTPALWMMLDV